MGIVSVLSEKVWVVATLTPEFTERQIFKKEATARHVLKKWTRRKNTHRYLDVVEV